MPAAPALLCELGGRDRWIPGSPQVSLVCQGVNKKPCLKKTWKMRIDTQRYLLTFLSVPRHVNTHTHIHVSVYIQREERERKNKLKFKNRNPPNILGSLLLSSPLLSETDPTFATGTEWHPYISCSLIYLLSKRTDLLVCLPFPRGD